MEKGEAIKGEQLIEKFIKYAHSDWDERDGFSQDRLKRNATQCSTIAVEEIIDACEDCMIETTEQQFSYSNTYKFWKEVLNYLKTKL